ncbi:TonB-dependent receptor [Desulfosarcina cetonica]|nr:TonB-dependent receptor [Desulfosarcina cetonica]
MKKMEVWLWLWVLMLLAGPRMAWAETYSSTESGDFIRLDPITVMATKTPKAPLDSPASVSVITTDEIDAFNSAHPFKALSLTEGIWPRQYRGGLADYWARPVIRGHRALVMVDGVNWYDYGYYSDTAAIPMPDVARIDVVRGPFSALYGTLAQTGVINYITKIPDTLTIDASASFGDWNTRYYSFRIGDRPFGRVAEGDSPSGIAKALGDRFFYSASFKSRTTDGYVTTPSYQTFSRPATGTLDPDTPVVTGWTKNIDPQTGKTRYLIGDQGDNWYEDYGLFVKTGYDFSEDTRLWYSFNMSKFEYGWEDGKSYLKNSSGTTLYDGDVYLQDGNDTYGLTLKDSLFASDPTEKKSFVHTLSFNHSVPDAVDIVGLLAYYDKETDNHLISSSRYKEESNSLTQADLSATLHAMDDRCLVTVGVQGVREEATVTDDRLSDAYDEDSRTSTYEETSGKNLTLGTFLQVEYTPIKVLTLYAGGRYDHWWGTDADYANEDGTRLEYDDVDDGQFSPKLSLVYRLMENGIIRASYGKSFEAPSLYYRTANYYRVDSGGDITIGMANPDLGPTTNTSWEVGTEWELWEKQLRLKATYFENDFEDMIYNKTRSYYLDDGTQVTEKQRINADEAEVNGIEISIEALLPYNMKAGLFYTHHWSEYTSLEDESEEGWEVDEVPTDMLSAWIGYFGRYVDASISYRYCDSRYDDDYDKYASDSYKNDDEYNLVDAKITVRPQKNVSLSLSVENLFDEKYYEYYRAAGRFYLGTLSVHF